MVQDVADAKAKHARRKVAQGTLSNIAKLEAIVEASIEDAEVDLPVVSEPETPAVLRGMRRRGSFREMPRPEVGTYQLTRQMH